MDHYSAMLKLWYHCLFVFVVLFLVGVYVCVCVCVCVQMSACMDAYMSVCLWCRGGRKGFLLLNNLTP